MSRLPNDTCVTLFHSTVVSRASAHVPHFKGSIYVAACMQTYMIVVSWVSAHTDQNREACLSAHGRLFRTPRYGHIPCAYMQSFTWITSSDKT